MTCVTCDGPNNLPPEHSARTGRHFDPHGHLTARLGDPIAPGALAVLYRDLDWTAQCVEALAGPESHGWIEIRKMTGDGTYAIHPETRMCEDCQADWEPTLHDQGAACSTCESTRSIVKTPAHAQTLIRRGMVTIIRGAELITHTVHEPARRSDHLSPVAPDDQVRQAIATAETAGVEFPQPDEVGA